jgi:hypothetical protein
MRLGAILYVIPATWAVLHLAFLAVEVIDYRWELQTNDDPHFTAYDLVYHGPQFLIALYVAATTACTIGLTSWPAQVVLGLSSCWIGLVLKSRLAAWRGRDWDPSRVPWFMKGLELNSRDERIARLLKSRLAGEGRAWDPERYRKFWVKFSKRVERQFGQGPPDEGRKP